jgi:sugar phosphate isomerase/epimerase
MAKNIIPEFGYIIDPTREIISEIRKASALGSDFVEIPFEVRFHPQTIMEKSQQILQELDNNGMFCTVHMAYWADLGSEYESVREGWEKECIDAIIAAHTIGAKKFLVHIRPQSGLSMLVPNHKRAIIKNLIESFWLLSKFAEERSIKFVIENEFLGLEKSFSVTNVLQISKKSKTEIAIDIAHAFVGNGNKRLKKIMKRLGSRIGHCHISDNFGEEDEHLPIGHGDIDFEMVVKELKRIGYGKKPGDTITFECFRGGRREYKSSFKKIKKMWEAQ